MCEIRCTRILGIRFFFPKWWEDFMETAYQVTCTHEDSSKLHGLMAGRVEAELLMTHQDCNRFATRMCAISRRPRGLFKAFVQLVSHLFVHAHEKCCFIFACKHLVQLQTVSGIEATPTRQVDMQFPRSGRLESMKDARPFIRYACSSFTDPNRPRRSCIV